MLCESEDAADRKPPSRPPEPEPQLTLNVTKSMAGERKVVGIDRSVGPAGDQFARE